MKTTAPKLYCVRPNASIVEPGKSVDISIILQGFSQPLPADYKCKDKFLIVSLPCPDLDNPAKLSDYWPTLEAKFKLELIQKKLRVNYVITDEAEDQAPMGGAAGAVSDGNNVEKSTEPIDPRDPNPEVTSNGASHATQPAAAAAAAAGIAGVGASSHSNKSLDNSAYQHELDDSNAKINNLSNRFDSNESSVDEKEYKPPSQASRVPSEEPVAGVSMPVAVALMLVSFLLGWLVF